MPSSTPPISTWSASSIGGARTGDTQRSADRATGRARPEAPGRGAGRGRRAAGRLRPFQSAAATPHDEQIVVARRRERLPAPFPGRRPEPARPGHAAGPPRRGTHPHSGAILGIQTGGVPVSAPRRWGVAPSVTRRSSRTCTTRSRRSSCTVTSRAACARRRCWSSPGRPAGRSPSKIRRSSTATPRSIRSSPSSGWSREPSSSPRTGSASPTSRSSTLRHTAYATARCSSRPRATSQPARRWPASSTA